MKAIRGKFRWASSIAVIFIATSSAMGQIVINEIMKEERTAGGGVIDDSREFVELYNAGNSPVDLATYALFTYDVTGVAYGSAYTFTGAPSTIIPAHGYYVIGDSSVPGVNHTPAGAPVEMFPDLVAGAIVLRDSANPFSGNVIDAVAYDMYRNGATGTSALPADLQSQIGSGFEGSPISPNAAGSQTRISYARYRDGIDTNKNGIDFGTLPITPGTTNNILPQNAVATILNVDAMADNTVLSDNYYGAFELGRVINPTVASSINPRAIPASPQGGKAIVAWDQTGGGNSVYSKELVKKFDLYAYVDKGLLGLATTTNDREYESSAYVIGSIDPLFENPDPDGKVVDTEPGFGAATRNGTSGVGWLFNQFETRNPADVGLTDHNKLYLIDFGDSGNSKPSANDWKIKKEYDLTTLAQSDWFRLGIDYNPTTHEVTARFGNDITTFTIDYDLVGTFAVGYREGLTGSVASQLALHNPPIFDLFQATLPGDYDQDGKVDAEDYVLWRKSPGTYGGTPGGYNTWRSNYGVGTGSGSGGGLAAGNVPEPSSALLALVGMLMAGAWGRRR